MDKRRDIPNVIFLVIGSVCVIFIFIFFYLPYNTLSKGQTLTPLENFFYGLWLVVFAVLAALVIQHYYSKKTVSDEIKSYGSSALRRLVVIDESLGRIIGNMSLKKAEAKKLKFGSKAESVLCCELFDNIYNQTYELVGQLRASQDDWRDILPEEFQEREKELKRISKIKAERDKTVRELQKHLDELKESGEDKDKEIENLGRDYKNKIAELQGEIDEIKTERTGKILPLGVTSSAATTSGTFAPPIDIWPMSDMFPSGCDNCGKTGENLQYCPTCSKIFCISCYNKHDCMFRAGYVIE